MRVHYGAKTSLLDGVLAYWVTQREGLVKTQLARNAEGVRTTFDLRPSGYGGQVALLADADGMRSAYAATAATGETGFAPGRTAR